MGEEPPSEEEILRIASDYLKQFDNRELVVTPEARTSKITLSMFGKREEGSFADLLSEVIFLYRVGKKDNPLTKLIAYKFVALVDIGRTHGFIVPGDSIYLRLKELEQENEKLREELEQLKEENEKLKEEIEELGSDRSKYISP